MEITELLREAESGDRESLDRLYAAVYENLRAMAVVQRGRGCGDDTLNATSVVHEVFLKLVGQEASWENRRHFFAVAARAMRQIQVDHARARSAAKRGGGNQKVPFVEDQAADPSMSVETSAELLRLDEYLRKMERQHPRKAQVVECVVFAGLQLTEVSEVLGISVSTVRRDWSMAMVWLHRQWASATRSQ